MSTDHRIAILGAAYGGEKDIAEVEVSTDGGNSWVQAEWIGPREPFAWRQWQYRWEARDPGDFRLMARVVDRQGQKQPLKATWNLLGYGNNGVIEHSIPVQVE